MNCAAKSLRSGELARLAGVSSDTLRHYERIGVLPESARTAAGYRMYLPGAIDRVRLVQHALRLGFTLAELSEILRVRDNGGAPCRRVLHMTQEKLRSLDRQIQDLRQTQRYMRQLVRRWRMKLKRTQPGQPAWLLHSLANQPTAAPKENGRSLRRRKLP